MTRDCRELLGNQFPLNGHQLALFANRGDAFEQWLKPLFETVYSL